MENNTNDNCSTKVEDFLMISDTDTGEIIISQRGNIKSMEGDDNE